MLDQRGAVIPGRVGRPRRHVVAAKAGKGDCGERLDPDALGERGVIGDDLLEPGAVVADQIHLVHRQHDVADADQVGEIRMAPRLGQHALARVDQDHRQVGGRGAGHHVAGILFVPRRVGDDELALFGGEEAIGDVDRDALFAFGGEPVDQQGEIDLPALRSHPPAVRLQRGELVVEDHLRIVQHPPDQRRLAVIDRSAGDEAQQRLVLVPLQIGIDVARDQRVGAKGGVRHILNPSSPRKRGSRATERTHSDNDPRFRGG